MFAKLFLVEGFFQKIKTNKVRTAAVCAKLKDKSHN